jgi:hypothetical protein
VSTAVNLIHNELAPAASGPPPPPLLIAPPPSIPLWFILVEVEVEAEVEVAFCVLRLFLEEKRAWSLAVGWVWDLANARGTGGA